MKIKYLIIHHFGGTQGDAKADTSYQTFKDVDDYHRSLGWGGCGYHYVIERTGKVTQGRKDNEIGAHTIGKNEESLGIALAGNFDVTLPTPEQIEALKQLVTDKMYEHHVPIDNVVPHRKFASKSCYGNLLSDNWIKSLILPATFPSEPCTSLKVELERKEEQIGVLQWLINSLIKFKK
jgi:N-acetylmuramoyl-L-alanine amidase